MLRRPSSTLRASKSLLTLSKRARSMSCFQFYSSSASRCVNSNINCSRWTIWNIEEDRVTHRAIRYSGHLIMRCRSSAGATCWTSSVGRSTWMTWAAWRGWLKVYRALRTCPSSMSQCPLKVVPTSVRFSQKMSSRSASYNSSDMMTIIKAKIYRERSR